MMGKKTDLAIINRSFWPHNQVLGEALLQFAERVSSIGSVCVITQAKDNLREQMDQSERGKRIRVMACRAHTDSSSGLIKRSLETLYFMMWVLFSLFCSRPAKVYVATDPPVFVPFIVFFYCKLFRAQYYYHLQDIHPEAASIIVPLNQLIFGCLRALDNLTIQYASGLITLSDDMKQYILQCSKTKAPITLLDNPSHHVERVGNQNRDQDVVFCGNAGRLQRMPLLMAAIREYLQLGGTLRFTFVGAGIYGPHIQELADAFDNVSYLGYRPAVDAADIVNQHRWALLPINDAVTRYAFPSKSSSYVLSGCGILAVCGEQTSVARWVKEHQVGITCKPERDALVTCFQSLEAEQDERFYAGDELLQKLEVGYFVERLVEITGFKNDR